MLKGFRPCVDPRVLVDMRDSDDGGVGRLGGRKGLVHTIDVITPIVDDPRVFGRIAAANAISDIYAMGAEPLCSVSLLCVPKAVPRACVRTTLAAASRLLEDAHAPLIGGHTLTGAELQLGFAVTGTVDTRRMITNRGARPGDRLLLTKALGTGILYQAMKKGLRTPSETRAVITSMTTTNAAAKATMVECGVRCATDVTGFGLVGHALNIARASSVDLAIVLTRVPMLPGVSAYLAAEVVPFAAQRNYDAVRQHLAFEQHSRGRVGPRRRSSDERWNPHGRARKEGQGCRRCAWGFRHRRSRALAQAADASFRGRGIGRR